MGKKNDKTKQSGWPFSHYLFRLIVTIMIPLFGSIAYQFYDFHNIQQGFATRTALNLGSDVANGVGNFLQETQQTAALLARRVQIRKMDPQHCDPVLRDLYAVLPVNANVSLLDLNMRFVCSARPLPAPAPVPLRHSAFDRALKGEASLSEPVRGALSKRWIVAAAHPVMDSAKRVTGVVTITIDIERLNPFISTNSAPPNTLATVFTNEGVVVAVSETYKNSVGSKVQDLPFIPDNSTFRPGTFLARGFDGVDRIYAIARVNEQGWLVLTGIPTDQFLDLPRRQSLVQLIIIVLLTIVATVGATILSRQLTVPIRAMKDALRTRISGNRLVRIPEQGPLELVELARSFNAALDAELEATERLSGIITTAMDAIITIDEKNRIQLVNPAAEKIFGYPEAALVGKPLNTLLQAQHHEAHDLHIAAFGRTNIASRAMGTSGQIVGVRANGEEFPIEASISQLGISPHKLYTVILRDITQRKRAEQLLIQAEARFRVIFEHAGIGIALVDYSDGRILRANQALAEMLGYNTDELSQLTVEDVSESEGYEKDNKLWQEMVEGLHVRFQMEKQYRRKDGSLIWGLLTSTLVRASDSSPQFIIGMLENITERKRSEDALRASEQTFRELVDFLPTAVYVSDASGRIERFNRCAVDLWGREPEAGGAADEFYASYRIYDADGIPVAYPDCPMSRVLRSGNHEYNQNIVIERPDKSRRTVIANVIPRRDARGSMTGAISCLTDITLLEQALTAVRASADRYRALFDQSVFGVAETEVATGRFIQVNRRFCEMLGYDKDELLEQDVNTITLPEDRMENAVQTQKLLALEIQGFSMDKRYLRKDGSVFWATLTVTALRKSGKQPDREISIVHDISERKNAEAAISAYADEMRRLSAKLSTIEENERRSIHRELHDRIGANLSALKLDLNLIGTMLGNDTRDGVGGRLLNAQKLAGETIVGVRDVLADLRPPALDDYGLLAALRIHARAQGERMGIPIEVQGTEIVPRLALVAETALFRIAQEALNNIAKHAQARHVEIMVEPTAARVRLVVADDGVGFAFRRIDPQGANWGLTTMRERAQSIGGDLVIESAPGGGTRIVVVISRETA